MAQIFTKYLLNANVIYIQISKSQRIIDYVAFITFRTKRLFRLNHGQILNNPCIDININN
jgi:hypothetical protein